MTLKTFISVPTTQCKIKSTYSPVPEHILVPAPMTNLYRAKSIFIFGGIVDIDAHTPVLHKTMIVELLNCNSPFSLYF